MHCLPLAPKKIPPASFGSDITKSHSTSLETTKLGSREILALHILRYSFLPARRTMSSKVVTSPNLTTNLLSLALAVRGSSALADLTLQICSYELTEEECLGTGNALLVFQRNSRQRIDFSGYCLGT